MVFATIVAGIVPVYTTFIPHDKHEPKVYPLQFCVYAVCPPPLP